MKINKVNKINYSEVREINRIDIHKEQVIEDDQMINQKTTIDSLIMISKNELKISDVYGASSFFCKLRLTFLLINDY
jgi:hypothetical protein